MTANDVRALRAQAQRSLGSAAAPAAQAPTQPKFINPSDLPPETIEAIRTEGERVMRAYEAEKRAAAAVARPAPIAPPNVALAMPALPGAVGATSPAPPLPFDWSVPQPTAEERVAVEAAFKALSDATRSLAELILLVDKHPEFWLSWAKASQANTMKVAGNS